LSHRISFSFIFRIFGFFRTEIRCPNKTSDCVATALPDSKCTPGDVLTEDKTIVCKSGYSNTVRDVPDDVKEQVFKEYGIPWENRWMYEVDHLISLQLGGSNDISNLWLESYSIAYGAIIKDGFENYLKRQVCDHGMSLKEAQRQISSNWKKQYLASPIADKEAANSQRNSLPAVKKSKSGICHTQGTVFYNRMLNFTPYNSLAACIASGGREPKK